MKQTPLIDGNLLIIFAGRFSGDATACVIAFDKNSGKTAWRAVTDYAAMSSPIIVSAADKRQLIVWSQQALRPIYAWLTFLLDLTIGGTSTDIIRTSARTLYRSNLIRLRTSRPLGVFETLCGRRASNLVFLFFSSA